MFSEKNCSLYNIVIDRYKFRDHKYLKNNVNQTCIIAVLKSKKTRKAYIRLNTNNVIIKQLINQNYEKD